MSTLNPATTIDVLEPVRASDSDYEQPAPRVVYPRVPATIAAPGGSEIRAGIASQATMGFSLTCDPIDLRHTHQVRDNQTGVVYDVVWSHTVPGTGLRARTRAGLTRTTGGV